MISCEAVSSSLHNGAISRSYKSTTTTSSVSHGVASHARTSSTLSQSEVPKPKSRVHGGSESSNLGSSSTQYPGISFPLAHSTRHDEGLHAMHSQYAVVLTTSDGKSHRLCSGKGEGEQEEELEEEEAAEQDDDEEQKGRRRTSFNSVLTPGTSTTVTGATVTSEEVVWPRDSPPNEVPHFQPGDKGTASHVVSVLNIVPHVKGSACEHALHKTAAHEGHALLGKGGNDASRITTSNSTTETSPFDQCDSNNNNNNNNSNSNSNNSDTSRDKKNYDSCDDDNGNGNRRSDDSKRVVDLTTARAAVALFLEHLCEDNKAVPVLTSDFHSHRLPPMSIQDYVDRITRYSYVSGETFIVGLMLLLKYSFFVGHPVSSYNVHRLLITSAVLGVKLRDDLYYSNDYYSRIGGISNTEMNKLELRFCTVLEWDMWIDEEDYVELIGLLQDLITPTATYTNATSTDPSTQATVSHNDNNENANEDDNEDDNKKETQSAEAVKQLRNRCWTERLLPWLRRFEESAKNRFDRNQRIAKEDLENEKRNGQMWNQQQQQEQQKAQKRFSNHPFDASGKNGYVMAEQVILPAVFNRHNNSNNNITTNNNNNMNNNNNGNVIVCGNVGNGGGVVVSSHATVVNVPSLTSGVACGLSSLSSSSQAQAQAQHVSQGSSTAMCSSEFGIMERAMPMNNVSSSAAAAAARGAEGPHSRTVSPSTAKTTGASSSGISIHAKPYFYKSSNNGSSHHQQHYQQLQPQQQQRHPRHADPLAGANAYSQMPNGSCPNNNSNGNYTDVNSAARFAAWRAPNLSNGQLSAMMNWGGTGRSGSMGFPPNPPQWASGERGESSMRRGGKKRPKPDHYQDYR